ncbi:MAG: Mov34/MPN/PAD-1 family protein [Chloroflexota bacterium]
MNVTNGTPKTTHIPYHSARHWIVQDQNPAQPAVQVFLTQKAYSQVKVHASSDLDNEVGGWLLGRWCWDANNEEEFIVVDETLVAPHTQNSSTHLTFTQDSQLEMLKIMEEFFPEKIVVGWYHTHPRMSIFLSSYDVFLHNNFFPHSWQVAMVVEPYNHLGGIFVRDTKNQLDPRKYYGFYELYNEEDQSVADWRNIRPGSLLAHIMEEQDDPV